MQLAPYPEYKESGQPFLGKIPAHWDLFRNGRLFSQRNETGFGELPILEVSLKTGVRVRDMDNLKRKQVMADREKYKRAAQGDIAYNMMRMWQGAIGVAPVDGLVSPAYVVVKPFPEVDCRYFSYLFRTTAYMNEVDAYSRGIVKDRNRLYWQDFKCMPSVVPPIAEQRQIVRFLNDVGGKIQRFIRNKRKLIELLKEQKQHIVNQAVTRGLNPNVKLKPSGVEWIGDIPEHWEVRRLKQLAKVQTGVTLGPITSYNGLVERPYLRVANVQNGKLDLDTVKTVFVPVHEIPCRELKDGDVLMTEGGDMDKLGRGCIWNNEVQGCLHQNHVFAVRTNKDVLSPEYLVRLMESGYGRTYFELTAKRTTNLASTNSSTLGRFPIPLPSIHEQHIILKQLFEKGVEFCQAINRAKREIELMREYRSRLIADVVTGQVDVRGIEVPETAEEVFSETADELDALDDVDEATTEDEA